MMGAGWVTKHNEAAARAQVHVCGLQGLAWPQRFRHFVELVGEDAMGHAVSCGTAVRRQVLFE